VIALQLGHHKAQQLQMHKHDLTGLQLEPCCTLRPLKQVQKKCILHLGNQQLVEDIPATVGGYTWDGGLKNFKRVHYTK